MPAGSAAARPCIELRLFRLLVLLQFFVQGRRRDAQDLSRTALVAARLCQGLLDGDALDTFELQTTERQVSEIGLGLRLARHAQMPSFQNRAVEEGEREGQIVL